MKKITILALLGSLVFVTSCRKKSENADGGTDTVTPPTITLNGAATLVWPVGVAYVDSGATAVDASGNSLVVNVDQSAVNTNLVGQYQVTYSATDADGVTAQKTRTINVEVTKATWLASWSVVHNLRAGTPNANLIATSCTVTEFSNIYTFAHTGGGISTPDASLDGTISGSNVTFAQKLITIYPALPNEGQYNLSGSGVMNNEGDEISANFQWTGACTLCGNGTGTATYAKL